MKPPGDRVLDWARSLFGDDVAERVFEPLVADWQHEWHETPAGTRRWRTWLAGWHAIFVATLMTGADMAAPWRADRTLRVRSATLLVAFSAAGIAVLMVPFLRYLEHPARGLWLLGYLLPSSLGLALSFALLPTAMACATQSPHAPARPRWFVVGVTMATVVALFGVVGWLSPIANQEWREALRGQPLARGVRELSLVELWTTPGSFGIPSARAASELWTRVSVIVVWPTALAVLGWRLGRRRTAVTATTLAFAWLAAAISVAAADPSRHIAREMPWLVMPCVWLAIAWAVKPSAPVPAAPLPNSH